MEELIEIQKITTEQEITNYFENKYFEIYDDLDTQEMMLISGVIGINY